MLYSWSTCLKEEKKIEEAYQMLKKQGIVTADPVHIDRVSVRKKKDATLSYSL